MKGQPFPTVQETKIVDGIYFTDYRAMNIINSQNCFLQSQTAKKGEYTPGDNPEILYADFKEFQNKIKFLEYSIKEIKKEENWDQDNDFKTAVLENLEVIIKNLNRQKLCLEAIKKLDDQSKILEENPLENLEEKTKEIEEKLKKYKETLNNNEDSKEGVYL